MQRGPISALPRAHAIRTQGQCRQARGVTHPSAGHRISSAALSDPPHRSAFHRQRFSSAAPTYDASTRATAVLSADRNAHIQPP